MMWEQFGNVCTCKRSVGATTHQESENLRTKFEHNRVHVKTWMKTLGFGYDDGQIPCCLLELNEPLGAKGPPRVGEEVRKKDVGKVGNL